MFLRSSAIHLEYTWIWTSHMSTDQEPHVLMNTIVGSAGIGNWFGLSNKCLNE